MRDPSFYVSGLLDLHKLQSAAERRATWRQSMAALARATADDVSAPLDGIHPEALLFGVKAALAGGLVDDLDWLAPGPAGAALYELASALPLGAEQRELGRRVMSRLLSGSAEGFVPLATRMALGIGKGLGATAVHSRVALVVELPVNANAGDGPLALTIASRRELAREWIGLPSTGSLPARRLAARLLERAAREAARRSALGDDHVLRAFRGESVAAAFKRLLADRESLVWRHVAVARGLLAPWVPELKKEMEAAFNPKLTPTEWRRGAASVAAFVAVNPEAALRDAKNALSSGLLTRDPGAAAAFVWGLPRAAEAEPDAARELFDMVAPLAPQEAAPAVVELRTELGTGAFTDRAAETVLRYLPKNPVTDDDGAAALVREVARDLERVPRADQPVREQLARALLVFGNDGAREAYAAARQVLDAARGALDALLAVSKDDEVDDGRGGSLARRTAFSVLRDLDISVVERNVLADLLLLGGSDSARAHTETLDNLRQRLTEWILEREAQPLPWPGGVRSTRGTGEKKLATPKHPTLRLQRLRALLHLADGDVGDAQEDGARAARLRQRWMRVAKALILRFERDPPSVLRRTITAGLARAVDALARSGACDITDVLLLVARHVDDVEEFETLAQAAMHPDVVHVLGRYARFLRETGAAADLPAKLEALERLARELTPEDTSARTETLRTALVRLHQSLVTLSGARSLRTLAGDGNEASDTVLMLETALNTLAHQSNGARSRMDPERSTMPPPNMATTRPLSLAVGRVLSGAQASLSEHVMAACIDELIAGVPKALAYLASSLLWHLVDLPRDAKEPDPTKKTDSTAPKMAEQLPAWLPARRTLGGFYVLRSLGAGAVGSVFQATRIEDKNDPQAEKFALKVPEYSATAARSVSESEFLQMFRSEASALVTLPQHPNLARFVTFDVGAKPKPILVMEMVEGTTLERLIESRGLDMKRALRCLDEVLAGLQAMHAVDVGHLDLKPSNVLLRRENDEAVLVDFGLAGRHIRPGCTTGPYGAPEVWGVVPGGNGKPTPMMADAYAFGCLAFEVLTGKTLFQADSETQQVALHVSHDGDPPAVRALGAKPGMGPVAALLHEALRRDPWQRRTVPGLRSALADLAPKLAKQSWPVAL